MVGPTRQPRPSDQRSAELMRGLESLTGLPGVAERGDQVRDAATKLRFHEALRRRIPEASAESRVRGARASAALDGAEFPVDLTRELIAGMRAWPDDPDPGLQILRGAVAATAESERIVSLVRTAPLQALARLHVAAASGLVEPDQLGRPRQGQETSEEMVDLGPAPVAADVPARLSALADLIAAAFSTNGAPALVVAEVVHAEIASIRPFVRGNGLVARAMERVLIQALGLDGTGVSVPEAGHVAGGGPAYLGALAAYGQGSADGVALWLRQAGEGVLAGVGEGMRICDAVRAGRLTPPQASGS